MASEGSDSVRDHPLPAEAARSRDLALVREIQAGSVAAWHRFVDSHGALILAVVRRHVRGDQDEIRGVFVEVLARLYRTRFRHYQGRAALSTWLVVVTRSLALDRLRRLRGRRGLPSGVRRLSALDQRVFHLHYGRGLSLDETWELLRARGEAPSREALLDCIGRIARTVDRGTLRRLSYARESTPELVSRRLREFLDGFRDESERLQMERTPQQELIEREARETVGRIMAMIDDLPAEERSVVSLHVLEDRPAREVAERLGIESPRRVYTLVERALRRLRRWIQLREARF